MEHTKMYTYRVYGLNIRSALPLPELIASAEDAADIAISKGNIDRPPLESDDGWTYVHLTSQQAYMYWEPVGTFLIRNGAEIMVDPVPDAEDRLVRLPLLGPVLTMLLYQRGHLALHASAVAMNGAAVIFLGGKGQGKSTMAAALYARGHTLLTDDVVALGVGNEASLKVLPGFPQFKLWPAAAASSLGDTPNSLPQLAPGVEKRARRVDARFSQDALPLVGVYVLGTGSCIQLKPLPAQEALVQLIANTYVARFGKHLLQGVAAANHLHQCTQLIRHVPVYSLERPYALDLLADIAQLVEDSMSWAEARRTHSWL